MIAPFERRPSAGRVALLVTAPFVLAGAGWVLLTDVLLYTIVDDRVLIARIETAKGWMFIVLASLLLYAFTFRAASRLTREQRLLATIVESIGDGVLLLGRDRAIVHANPAALGLLRCERPEELRGMGAEAFSRRYRVSWPDGGLLSPDQFVSQRVFEEGGPLRHKCVLHPPGGGEIVVSCIGAAVRERADEPPALVVSVLHDITESEHLNRLYDQFFSNMAHALKTPIAVIDAHARIFSQEPSARVRRSAAAVERQCARIDALVQNILILERAHSGTLRLHPHPALLSSILARTAADRAVVYLGRRVETRIVEDVRAHVDDERMVTALRNLVTEAAHSAPEGALTLVLRRTGQDAELGVCSRWRAEEPPVEGPLDDDRGVGREVTEIIVAAHGGSRYRERTEQQETWWIRLPALWEE